MTLEVVPESSGDGYRRAGWLIRQKAPWPAARLRALIAGLTAERKKGLFLTDLGWQAVNQSDWSAIAAPEDGRSGLELIDPAPLDTRTIDSHLRKTPTP